MEHGTVKWYNEVKGYGFIERGPGEKDIFVHVSGIMRSPGFLTLKKEEKVIFEIENGPKGPKAVRVRQA